MYRSGAVLRLEQGRPITLPGQRRQKASSRSPNASLRFIRPALPSARPTEPWQVLLEATVNLPSDASFLDAHREPSRGTAPANGQQSRE